ncbi:MAG: thrombospondin type 3 repeat-containing protein, partial [Flavobacteriales bacterium]
MKHFLVFFFLSFAYVYGQNVFIGSDSQEFLKIKSGTEFYIQGLVLNPSSDFKLIDNIISKSNTTSNSISSSINRSYSFLNSSPIFSGSLSVNYLDSELNGEIETNLDLVSYNGSVWEKQSILNLNSISNKITVSITNKSLIEITLSFDSDGDGIVNSLDNCLTVSNTTQLDSDGDGVGDVCDNCIETSNSDQANNDGDTQGDVCDLDDDNDGVPDSLDAFPTSATESIDTDGDDIGDNADPDADND